MDTVCDQRTQGQGHSGTGLQEPFCAQTFSVFLPHSPGGHCGELLCVCVCVCVCVWVWVCVCVCVGVVLCCVVLCCVCVCVCVSVSECE